LDQKQTKSQNFNFDFAIDDKNKNPSQYKDASIVNVFFIKNVFHDVLFRYGFDEKSGNFQRDNLLKEEAGIGNDPVLAIVQDGEGLNNANFLSPDDGISGIMKMFVFDKTSPNRDGSLVNSIVVMNN
jgi:extracellular elastinolytic metalloproteinase